MTFIHGEENPLQSVIAEDPGSHSAACVDERLTDILSPLSFLELGLSGQEAGSDSTKAWMLN